MVYEFGEQRQLPPTPTPVIPTTTPVPQGSISFTNTPSILYVGAVKAYRTFTLQTTSSGNVGTIKFKSSDKEVAKVSAKGVITAKKAGKATITAYSSLDKKIKTTCKVKVKKPTLKVSWGTKKTNGAQIVADVYPPGKVSYTSSNEAVATVNKKGWATFTLKKGTVVFKVTCNGITVKTKVKVKNKQFEIVY